MLDIKSNRRRFTHYLRGQGMEIEALDSPLEIAHDMAKVQYVDYKSTEALRKQYPTLNNFEQCSIAYQTPTPSLRVPM